jgi:hypothetical protein
LLVVEEVVENLFHQELVVEEEQVDIEILILQNHQVVAEVVKQV